MDDLTAINKESVDIYRDTPVRYLGYANEIGEAFRIQIGKWWVRSSYAVSIAYVLADAGHKTWDKYNEMETLPSRNRDTIITAADTLIWQMFASVAVPGFTINRVCAGSNYLLKRTPIKKLPRKWAVTAIGLSTIPFIIKPIDRFVDTGMDHTFRRWIA